MAHSSPANAPNLRMQKIESLLMRRLAALIQRELHDPHLGMINISHIDVSKDLSHAMIFITILNDDKKIQAQHIAILNKAAHHLRFCLSQDSTWRKLPALHFKYDDALVRSQHLVDLLEDIAAKHK